MIYKDVDNIKIFQTVCCFIVFVNFSVMFYESFIQKRLHVWTFETIFLKGLMCSKTFFGTHKPEHVLETVFLIKLPFKFLNILKRFQLETVSKMVQRNSVIAFDQFLQLRKILLSFFSQKYHSLKTLKLLISGISYFFSQNI